MSFGSGELSLVSPTPPATAGSGLAIDQATHDVYVADTGDHRVSEFEANGTFVRAFGKNVGGLGVDVCGGLVSCEPTGTEGAEPGAFTTPVFLAVDNDPASPSFHDVYVGDTGDDVVSKFSEEGVLEEAWGTGGQLKGTGAAELGSLMGVAVDGGGRLLVLGTQGEGNAQEFVFDQAGGFVEELRLERTPAPNGIAVDSGGDLFKVNGDGSVEESSAAGAEVGTVTHDTEPSPPRANAIAVEPSSGGLFVANAAGTIDHYAFNGAGQVLEPDGSACRPASAVGCGASDSTSIAFAGSGIAVSSASGDTYVANPSTGEVSQYGPLVTVPDVVTSAASEVGAASATLNGTVNPDGISVTACEFEYVSDTKLRELAGKDYQELISAGVPVQNIFKFAGAHAPCEEPDDGEIGNGTSPVGVHAGLAGLTPPGDTYHFRLVAGNANGSSAAAVQAFTTVTPPAIDSATVSKLAESSATLNAEINPDNGRTTYRFEYGAGAGYGTSVPIAEANIGPGSSDVFVGQRITGLTANTTYHWRVVATNAAGTTTGVDHTFVYPTEGADLPDGRAYEMVTPAQKNGALLGESSAVLLNGLPYSIASDGSRLIMRSIQCFDDAGSCTAERGRSLLGSPYEFTRTSQGWVTTALSPPASQFSSSSYWSFDATTGAVLFSMPTEPFGEDDFYVREEEPTNRFVDVGPNTPPEAGPQGPVGGDADSKEQADTPNYSHVAWETTAQWPFDLRTGLRTTYEYPGAQEHEPLLVGVSGGEGSHALISACGTILGGGTLVDQGEMSEDGGTVFFTAKICPTGGTGVNSGTPVPANILYARVDGELSDAHTVSISAPSPSECGSGSEPDELVCRQAASEPAAAGFLGASADGSKAFFTSTQQLTDEASEDNSGGDTAQESGCVETTGQNGCNLYEYDLTGASGHELIDISAGDTSGQGPRVRGVMAISADGSHVYFVAQGVLTGVPNDRQEHPQNGADNLYVYESGRTAFIATLPSSDSEAWNSRPGRPANVTPAGQFLVFLSHGDLTSDDTSLSGASQVFRYDAATGQLMRLSIGDKGFNDNGNRSHATPCGVGGVTCSENASIAPPDIEHEGLDLTMSDDGARVFFTSPVALTSAALDDAPAGGEPSDPTYARNVYEWEKAGVGSCPAEQGSGCVYLISDGHDVNASKGSKTILLLGSDATGDNVFFASGNPLTGENPNGELDYYDARVCTSEAPCLARAGAEAVSCERNDACQGVPAGEAAVPSAVSITFSGPGNIVSGAIPGVAADAAVKVLRHAVTGFRIALSVAVPSAGRITITGRGIRVLRRAVGHGGTYRLTVTLTAGARAALHRARGRGMTVRLRVGYRAADGHVASVYVTTTVRGLR